MWYFIVFIMLKKKKLGIVYASHWKYGILREKLWVSSGLKLFLPKWFQSDWLCLYTCHDTVLRLCQRSPRVPAFDPVNGSLRTCSSTKRVKTKDKSILLNSGPRMLQKYMQSLMSPCILLLITYSLLLECVLRWCGTLTSSGFSCWSIASSHWWSFRQQFYISCMLTLPSFCVGPLSHVCFCSDSRKPFWIVPSLKPYSFSHALLNIYAWGSGKIDLISVCILFHTSKQLFWV